MNTHVHIEIDPPLFGIYSDTAYLWLSAEVHPEEGFPGQWNPNPLAIFENHQFIKFNHIYYDPSYGLSYEDVLEFQQEMVTGFFRPEETKQLNLPDNYWYWLRKIRPPHPTVLQLIVEDFQYPFPEEAP